MDEYVTLAEAAQRFGLAEIEAERDRYAEMLAACPQGLAGHSCCDCPADR